MKFGIIAEGHDDIDIIKQVLKKLTQVDTSEMHELLPAEASDETDNATAQFSNWELVLNEAKECQLLDQFFEYWNDATPIVVIHIDTAERGEANYNVTEPARTRDTDYTTYSEQLRENVKSKIQSLIPERYHEKITYAIAIEETEAWLIPMFENSKTDTATKAKPKETLRHIINTDKKLRTKYFNTDKKRPDAHKLGKELSKNLKLCRSRNKSLDIFCLEVEMLTKEPETQVLEIEPEHNS